MTNAFALIAGDGGAAAARPAPAPKSYGTPSQILDNLEQVESSGGKNNFNPNSGATGPYQFLPSTVQMLANQGMKFDPNNPAQARQAADYYLHQLYQKYGNWQQALAAYGGFQKQDPTSYVDRVTGSTPGASTDAAPPTSQNPFSLIASDSAAAPTQTASSTSTKAPAKPKVQNGLTGFLNDDPVLGTLAGAAEVPAAMAGQAAGAVVGGLHGLWDLATGNGLDKAAADVQGDSNRLTRYTEPETNTGKALTHAVGIPFNLLTRGADYVGSHAAEQTGSPLFGATLNTAIQAAPLLLGVADKPESVGANKLVGRPGAQADVPAPHGSVGASATSTLSSAAAAASPELRAAVQDAARKGEAINAEAVQRHVEASQLPVPVKLTAGQASQDINLLSREQNERGRVPELAQRFNEQNQALADNVQAFRDQAAPDVFDADHVESGQGLIDAYKAKDAALQADISAKYQALKDANGGQFPVDAGALYSNIAQAFKKDLNSAKLEDGPVGAQMRELHDLAEGGGMTMEQYLTLRRNLGTIARTASDGTDRAAASMAVDELEQLPLAGGAADLKPLADAARSAARSRFDLIKSDPAYKAAISDVAPDKFIAKYVVNAPVRDVQAMRDNLAQDPLAAQRMSAGALNWLRERAGLDPLYRGNFSQAGYNKALAAIGPKVPVLFDGDTGKGLQTLGDVGRYTQAQPRGSYVNNSNTFVANVKDHAGKAIAGGADYFFHGLPVGTTLRNALLKSSYQKEIGELLKPGAGISNRLTGTRR